MFLTLLSSILLILAFPKFSLWPLAWVALVPVFFQIERAKRSVAGFLFFYLFGFLFLTVSVEWLRHVSYFGWLFVAVSYAFYFGLFGLAVQWCFHHRRFGAALFFLPAVWLVLEWVRTEIPVAGFGWNLLAYSQSDNLAVARLGSWVGAFGVSGLMVLANVSVFLILRGLKTKDPGKIKWGAAGLIAMGSVFLAFHVSRTALHNAKPPETFVHAAVIQGNIPQSEKWDPAFKSSILETYESLTRFTVPHQPDVVIWPEAAFPGYFDRDAERARLVRFVSKIKTPLLFGSPHAEAADSGPPRFLNSAYLLEPGGVVRGRYDKIRLVPFGEYVPWPAFFRPLGLERLAYSLGVSDFQAGSKMNIFSLGERRFASLICFEDTFPNLARAAKARGAQFLVVLTNDAWFSKSAAPYQHLQASIFRAVENGIPVVRAANTGISAFVNGEGEVEGKVQDQFGFDSFVTGGMTRPIAIRERTTWYTRAGHYLPFFCLALIGGLLLTPKMEGKNLQNSS